MRRSLKRLLCAALIASLLFWRSPSYVSAQNARKDAQKKDSAESPKSPADTSATNTPPLAEASDKTADSTAASDSSTSTAAEKSSPSSDKEKGSQSKGDGEKSAASKGGGDKGSSSDEIQLSFQGANIDMIVQWLSETTGKSVVKHPRVQCQLTIVGAKKISKRDAVTLVYRALGLEGFTAIESSKSILIVPEGSEPKMAPELLGAPRGDIPEGRQKLVKIFPLKHIQAAELKEKVKSVLSEKAGIDTDDRANQIIITDYNDNLVMAAQLISALDSDKPQDVSVRVIPLKHVSAQDLVKEVAPLYQKLAGKGAKEVVEVAANDRSNSLLVLSSEANFRTVEKVIEMLDTEEAQEKALRAFPLKNAEAQDVAKQLQELYQDQDNSSRYPYYIFGGSPSSGKNTKKMSVVADRRRNTVIVEAPPASMENIAKIIEDLDEAISDESLAPRIYPLKYVSAGDIEDILNELFLKKTPLRSYWSPWDDSPPPSNVDRDVGRLYGKVRITSEPHSNALIITSNSAENLAAVEAVIKELDVPSEAGDTTLRVSLNFAKAFTVANNINILFAKGGSPPLRPLAQPGQPQNQPQQQQQQTQTTSSQNNFELDQEAKDEGYFPWLGGQQDNPRSSDARSARPVSDLVGRVRVVPDQRSNALLISANVHFFPQVLKLVEELDVPTAQVLIEARIVEVSSDFLHKLGVRWSPDGSRVFTPSDYDNSLLAHVGGRLDKGYGKVTDQLPFNTSTTPTPSGNAVVSALSSLHSGVLDGTVSMDFLIQFLRENTDATVLAEPQINIEDNQTGKLFVGQQVPILDNSIITQVGGQSTGFKYKDVGVVLEVTPHINSSGDVALKIHAESSSIVPGQTILNGAVFDTRNFKTDLEAKNGQTLVLGGIIQKQVSDTMRKTPMLGSIPGLGWAFKKKDKTAHEVELIVFLRPRVVRSPEDAKQLLEEVDKRAPKVKKWQEDSHSNLDPKSKSHPGS